MSETLHQQPFGKTKKRSFAISISLHILLFLICFFVSISSSPPPPMHRLVVQTIALNPGPVRQVVPEKIVEPPLPQVETPQEPSPTTQEEIAETPPPEVTHEEEASPPPSPQPAQTPQKAAPKKAAPTPKKAPTPAKKPDTKKTTTSPNKKSSPKKPTYDQKLLQEAMQRLNTSKSLSGKKSSVSTGKATSVGSVGKLHSEEGVPSIRNDAGDDAPQLGSPESSYLGDLVRRLQLHIRLPEPGEAKVKLTITKKGVVSSVEIINCKSQQIRKVIAEKLKGVPFSPFGSSFPGESEHTFTLRLSNDLVWSCS
jgi:outer membrane biosynthesis protein TonB